MQHLIALCDFCLPLLHGKEILLNDTEPFLPKLKENSMVVLIELVVEHHVSTQKYYNNRFTQNSVFRSAVMYKQCEN